MVDAMVSSQLVMVFVLVALDIILYLQLVRTLLSRRTRRLNAENLAEAFEGLEAALKQAVPDLPAGFTWGDALARLKSAGVQTDGMKNALKGYEDYRYGMTPLPNLDYREVVVVANMLGGINAGKRGKSSLGQ